MKTKTIINSTVLYLLWNGFIYCAFAFYSLEPNPTKWDELHRFFTIGFGWLIGLSIYAFMSIGDKK